MPSKKAGRRKQSNANVCFKSSPQWNICICQPLQYWIAVAVWWCRSDGNLVVQEVVTMSNSFLLISIFVTQTKKNVNLFQSENSVSKFQIHITPWQIYMEFVSSFFILTGWFYSHYNKSLKPILLAQTALQYMNELLQVSCHCALVSKHTTFKTMWAQVLNHFLILTKNKLIILRGLFFKSPPPALHCTALKLYVVKSILKQKG